MKYKIIVETNPNGSYRAYSPVASILSATGGSVGSALGGLQQKIICYLHDPEIELDIVIRCDGTEPMIDFSRDGLHGR